MKKALAAVLGMTLLLYSLSFNVESVYAQPGTDSSQAGEGDRKSVV